jgi:hypothetical protein
MRSDRFRFTKLRIGVVQEFGCPAGQGGAQSKARRSAGRPPALQTESPGAARQRNRSSRAAKPARQTMLIENSKSLISIGRR